ncbi:HD domain-containing protein [Methanolobus halotolerans]|uniref:Phosphohydrolase n=1 Tax=Methanolobus halotolerans TaxID=2052935 RepID=A0A4E0PYJ7_9EURY|nr:HD domain-containing protein [Methanolobus halotolerans]TGC11348.1 phosphohydrolase [Methanolobus halotolerans]
MDLIERTRGFVAEVLADEPSTHDISHIERVEALCLEIREKEGGDLKVLRLAALLHDIGIVREHREGGNHAEYGAETAREFLSAEGVESELIEHVASCILTHRFSRGMKAETTEACILQDADRLDALGAVGIFRSLVSMGALRALKNSIGTVKETSMNAYTDNPFDGFYDYMEKKPFRIMDRLNTETAKVIAEQRLRIMHLYLEELKREANQEKQKWLIS